MTFHYTAWDAQSRMCKGELAAEDRSTALRTLQERGFTPISLAEGPVAGGGLPRLPSLARLRLPFALLAALLLLAGAALFLNARRKRPRPAPAPSAAHAKPATAPAPAAVRAPTSLTPPPTHLPEEMRRLVNAADEKRMQREKRFGSLTPENVQPPFEEEPKKEPPKEDLRPFRTASEQLLSMALSGQPGESVPPLPVSYDDDLEEDAAKALKSTIYVFDDDSEATLAHKMNVAEAKEQLRELQAKEGWTAVEYIKAIEAQRKEDAQLKRELYQELEKMVNDPTVSYDKIISDLSEINDVLAERGIPPIQEAELGLHEEE